MKLKLLTLSILLSVFTLSSYAQKDEFGIKAGLNISSIGGDSRGIKAKPGFHAGVYASIYLSNKFKFQPEIIYSQQGAEVEQEKTVFKYNYINIPLLCKFYVKDGLSLNLGPQIGGPIKGKAKVDKVEVDILQQMNGIDISLGMGVMYETANKVNFGIRYNLGLTSTTADESKGYFPNRVFQLSVGYRFN